MAENLQRIFPLGTDLKTPQAFAYNLSVINHFLPKPVSSPNRMINSNQVKVFKAVLHYIFAAIHGALPRGVVMDMFTGYEIDPDYVAKGIAGIQPRVLKTKVPEPYHARKIRERLEKVYSEKEAKSKLPQAIQEHIDSGEFYFENLFEDILFRLQNDLMPFSFKDEHNDAVSQKFVSIQILESITVRKEKNGKKRYFFTLSDSIIRLLNQQFVFSNSETAIKLIQSNTHNTRAYDFYQLCLSAREEARKRKLPYYDGFTFNKLKEVLQFDYKEDKRIKNEINTLFKKLKENSVEDLNVELRWDKNSERSNYNYKPVFYFTDVLEANYAVNIFYGLHSRIELIKKTTWFEEVNNSSKKETNVLSDNNVANSDFEIWEKKISQDKKQSFCRRAMSEVFNLKEEEIKNKDIQQYFALVPFFKDVFLSTHAIPYEKREKAIKDISWFVKIVNS